LANFIRDNNYNSIHKPIKTRWNYQMKLIRGVLGIEKASLDSILTEQGFEKYVLSSAEYNILVSLADILDPFEEITELTEGDKYSTISMVIPSVYLLKEHLKTFKSDKNLKSFIKKLDEELNRRFFGIFEMIESPLESSNSLFNDKSYLISSFCDPLFKLHWIDSLNINQAKKESLINYAKQLMIAECRKMIETPSQTSSSSSISAASSSSTSAAASSSFTKQPTFAPNTVLKNTTNTNSPNSQKRRHSKMFDYSIKPEKSHFKNDSSTEINKIRNEIENYLKIEFNEEIDSECFWRANKAQFPYLFKIAVRYLSIPASSSPVERVFSICGYINRPHRSRITPEHLEQIVLVKTNFKILD